MSAARQDYLRTYIGQREVRAAVWRWTAASEFGSQGAMSFSAAGFDFQTSMSADDMRMLAAALNHCASDMDAEAGPQKAPATPDGLIVFVEDRPAA